MIAATITARSVNRPTLSALMEPSRTDITNQMIAAGTTSDRVTGNLWRNWSTTLRSFW